MPVEIGEVDVLAADKPREPQRPADANASAHPRADDPLLAIAIDRANALHCSRDLRLRAD